jgi:hypothetical protein
MARTRLIATLAVAALPVALAMPAAAAAPTASKRSCKVQKEDKGCKLPKKATYRDTAGDTIFNVGQRVVGDADKTIYNAGITVTVRTGQCAPQEDDVAPQSGIGIKKRPRVGKTYKGKRSEPNPPADPDVSRVDVASGKVKVLSAKKVKISVKGTVFFVHRPQPYQCDFNIKKTLKREN